MAVTLTYDKAFHLLLRGGFGHDGKLVKGTDEAKMVRKLADIAGEDGTPAAIDYLLDVRPTDRQGPGKTNTDQANWDKLQKWWFDRMIKARKPVYEKMVLFLHQHFATARSTVNKSLYMAIQNALFREFAFGDFRALVKRVNIDGAMLWWLNGDTSTAAQPNENYAREVQQLFVLGPSDFNGSFNYSQVDIQEAAKVLTGWTRSEPKDNEIAINFSFSRHSKGSKTIYAPGVETPNIDPSNQYTINANSMDATAARLEHETFTDHMFTHVDTEGRPTAARFIARRMWKFFAYEPDVDVLNGTGQQDKALIDALADVFTGPDPMNPTCNLKDLLRAMFLRDEFYADTTRTVKGPVEYVMGSTRMLGGKLKGDKKDAVVPDTGSELSDMGQELLNPPNVFSWRGNLFWITTQTLFGRYEYAKDLGDGTKRDDLGFDISKLMGPSVAIPDTTQATKSLVVDRFLKLLLANPAIVDATTRTQLIGILTDNGLTDPIDLSDTGVQDKIRELVKLILTTPHFQVY
jgi:uncharacterized protein (DUF1800 family)